MICCMLGWVRMLRKYYINTFRSLIFGRSDAYTRKCLFFKSAKSHLGFKIDDNMFDDNNIQSFCGKQYK